MMPKFEFFTVICVLNNALQSAYMASADKWGGKEWDALRKFEDVKRDEYREELLRFQSEHPEYILVIKDAEAVIDSDMSGKSYEFLNKLASKAKVIIRGRNQRAGDTGSRDEWSRLL